MQIIGYPGERGSEDKIPGEGAGKGQRAGGLTGLTIEDEVKLRGLLPTGPSCSETAADEKPGGFVFCI